MAEGWTILFPISRPAGALFSAKASASARNAYSAGPGLGLQVLRWSSSASKQTGNATVASGRVQLRRIASATATRIEEAWLSLCFSRLAMNFSKSWIVTRPAAPLPGRPAKSAACRPSSTMRAFMRGDM